MKHFILAASLALSLATPAFAADPVEGLWQTSPDDNGNFGHIQVKPCGTKICGTLVKSFGPDGKQITSPNVGKQIVWDMVGKGGGKYGDGKVWSPDRNKTYNSKMSLMGNKLEVRGCVAFICRGSDWSRVN